MLNIQAGADSGKWLKDLALRNLKYISVSAKGVAAVLLVLISPIVVIFSIPFAVGVSADLVHAIGLGPAALGLFGTLALFALYKLHHPD